MIGRMSPRPTPDAEKAGSAVDRTRVEIVTAGGATVVFALSSQDPSTSSWVSSGAISLAQFAGQSIQVRFVFDTVDGFKNNKIGWLVDDVVVTGLLPAPLSVWHAWLTCCVNRGIT